MKWIKLPPHKSNVIIEEWGMELEFFFKHNAGKKSVRPLLFRIQKRWGIRRNVIGKSGFEKNPEARLANGEFILSEEYISTGESALYLDSPFIGQYLMGHSENASYGRFDSMVEIESFVAKEFSHIFSCLGIHQRLAPEESLSKLTLNRHAATIEQDPARNSHLLETPIVKY